MNAFAVHQETIRNGNRPRLQSAPEFLKATEAELAARAVRGTWAGQLKRHGRLMYEISRARQNGGPLATLYVWLRSLRNCGAPKALAIRLLVALQMFIDFLWDSDAPDDAALLRCSLAETESEFPVNRLQIVLASGYCPVSAAELIERCRFQAANLLALAHAYEARLLKETA